MPDLAGHPRVLVGLAANFSSELAHSFDQLYVTIAFQEAHGPRKGHSPLELVVGTSFT